MGAAAIPILGSVIGLGGAVGSTILGRRAEREAKKEQERRLTAQRQEVARLESSRADAQRTRALAAGRQQSAITQASSLGGARSTLLTGPSGLSAPAPGELGERKTLLGL